MSDDNIVQLVNPTQQEAGRPQFPYFIMDKDGDVHEVFGFPVFSPQYVMIMREFEGGQTVPVFMLPLDRVRLFELDDLDDDEDAPF